MSDLFTPKYPRDSQSQAASVQQHGSAAFLTPQAAAVPSATTVTNRTPKAGRPIHDDVPNVVWWRNGYYAICCPFCRANATHPKGKKDDEKGFAGIVGLHGQCVQHYEKGSDIPHPKITQDELFEICGKQLIPPPIAAEMMDGGQTNFVKKAPAPPAHSSGGRYSSAHSDDSYVQSEDRGTRDSVASTTTWSNATSLLQRVETPAPGPSNAATSVNQRTGCPSQYDTQPSIKRERSSNAAEGRNDPSERQHTDTAEFDEAEDEFLPAEEIDAMMMMMYSGKGKAPASRENGWA